TISSVAALLAMDRTTLTANLKPLDRRGLVKVAVDKDDKRSRRLIITAAGRALLARAFPVWRKAHAKAESLLTGISADALRAALRALSWPDIRSAVQVAFRPKQHDYLASPAT
ncbi:MAG: hypothetical protein ACREQD_16500, partial [Candidatus Binataceae bacterium]